MDLLTLFIILLILYFLTTCLSTPEIPSPSLREYFPYGQIYPALRDYRAFGRILHNLAAHYGQVFRVYLGFRPMLVTSNPEDIAQILSTTHDFPRDHSLQTLFKTVFPGGLLEMNPHVHAEARRTLRENFNQMMLQSFQKEMNLAIKELCETFSAAVMEKAQNDCTKIVDISQALYMTTFRVITNVALGSGMSTEERMQFNGLVDELIDEFMKEFMYYPLRQWMTPFGVRKRFFDILKEVRVICGRFIVKRMNETEEERGSVTTAQELVWCMYELCQNENVRIALEKEVDEVTKGRPLTEPMCLEDMRQLKYVHKVWKETLRLYSVNIGFPRITSKDVKLRGSGVQLQKGSYVYAFVSRAHRDPEIWTDASKFDPDRWEDDSETLKNGRLPLGAFVPFSMGRKGCAGRFLADYEGPLILAELVRRFRFELGCRTDEIVSCTSIVETAQWLRNGKLDRRVPVKVETRKMEEN